PGLRTIQSYCCVTSGLAASVCRELFGVVAARSNMAFFLSKFRPTLFLPLGNALDLRVVLDLVNRGRTALGLEPFKQLPVGIVEDPFEYPLGRSAFHAGIGKNACTCYCPEATAHLDRRSAA